MDLELWVQAGIHWGKAEVWTAIAAVAAIAGVVGTVIVAKPSAPSSRASSRRLHGREEWGRGDHAVDAH
ncbi:hypothetical protein [Streptomyces scabiei]|uniref:hypothetical protein n=1 Tax=Streptomyces scabiei TaxID=1930 RepID=UPI00076607F9|nr:hypothetical protein [Streptomyces scabiei]MDX2540108.1 hypothetical protein [Streptomyces scabiei]MDX2802257.1 hypothetical protein [Streptomyces scabiei]MDX2856038.1 hypothetical protein [Streptomyces scabiei]MDX3030445.1 hypothetical protein [Streptomyces scabiei]MDX3830382.1 hypothetical protein [Streptomyces scabiei]